MREVTPVSAHCDLNTVQRLVVKAKEVSSISSTVEVIFISQSFADRLLILREYWFREVSCLQKASKSTQVLGSARFLDSNAWMS